MTLPANMTPDMIIVFGFLIFVTLLFVFEIVRVDMVGLLMIVLLPLSGIITPQEAISGLSSNAVVSIIAVIIIGHGLDKTGVMNVFAKNIVKFSGQSQVRMMTLVSGTVAVISSFMQNIGAAALFLPATKRMCKQLNVPVSRVLIPMGYCAVIGGCITLVGSSPLILLNDLIASWWSHNPSIVGDQPFEAFSLFSVAPIGIALVISAILYFVLFGKFVLPKVDTETDSCSLLNHDLECTYGGEVSKVFELRVPDDFYTRRLEELKLRPLYHSTVVCICKHQGRYRVDELDQLNGVLSADESGITEAIVTPRSELVGKTFHEYQFRKNLQVNPLALYRRGKVILEDISEIKIQLSISLLTGAVGMILTKVLSLDEAYRSVDWMTVFLLAGLIPLGLAFDETGAASYLASSLAGLMEGGLTPITLFLLIGFLTSFFTLVTSNIGATVLMIPLAMNMAVQCSADPRMVALLVAVAASNTFVLPTHQVNALIMRPGGYKVKDYVRAGSGMTILYIAVVMMIMYFFYGITA